MSVREISWWFAVLTAAWVIVWGLVGAYSLYQAGVDRERFLDTSLGACFSSCVDNGLPREVPKSAVPCVCSVRGRPVPWVSLSDVNVSLSR